MEVFGPFGEPAFRIVPASLEGHGRAVIGDRLLPLVSVSDTTATTIIPAGPIGDATLRIRVSGKLSNGLQLTIEDLASTGVP